MDNGALMRQPLAMERVARVSDTDRERMARFLGERSAEGYISVETLVERIDCAYAARSRDDLEALARDLPGHPEGWMRTTWHRLTGAAAETLRVAGELVEAGAARRLVLDGAAAGRLGPGLFTIGRAVDCDVVLADPTASRCHAELRYEDGTWVLTDLRSRNGSFVNGRRAWRIVVEAGDELVLGGTRLTFAPVPSSRTASVDRVVGTSS